jgi:hypothetical protein
MHRAIRKKQSQGSEDDKTTADEAIKSERCAIPRQIYNEISTIASASKKTNCEVQIEVLREWTELKKLQNECAQPQAQGIRDDGCKYVSPK